MSRNSYMRCRILVLGLTLGIPKTIFERRPFCTRILLCIDLVLVPKYTTVIQLYACLCARARTSSYKCRILLLQYLLGIPSS